MSYARSSRNPGAFCKASARAGDQTHVDLLEQRQTHSGPLELGDNRLQRDYGREGERERGREGETVRERQSQR